MRGQLPLFNERFKMSFIPGCWSRLEDMVGSIVGSPYGNFGTMLGQFGVTLGISWGSSGDPWGIHGGSVGGLSIFMGHLSYVCRIMCDSTGCAGFDCVELSVEAGFFHL